MNVDMVMNMLNLWSVETLLSFPTVPRKATMA